MRSTLRTVGGVWRVVLRRAASDRVILAAAFVTILLSTTLLSAGPIYAAAVTSTGLQRSLQDAPTTVANLELSRPVAAASYADVNERVVAAVQDVFRPIGAEVSRSARSGSFALPGQDEVSELAVLAFFDNIEQHATLEAGEWPSGAGSVDEVEAVLSTAAATAMEVGVGGTMALTDRLSGDELRVRIVGTYTVDDPSAVEWWNEPLETEGVEEGTFTVYGPFVVTEEAFVGALEGADATARWRVAPAFGAIGVSDLGPLLRGLDGLDERLNQGEPSSRFVQVETGLPSLLEDAERSLLVTRSGVLISTVQLALLAAYALLFTAGLVIEQRRVETALLRARGAAPRQLAGMALIEGLLLAVPAILLGPPLAALTVRALDEAGPLADVGMRLAPEVSADAYLLATVTALACVAALVFPTVRSARSYMEARTAMGRESGPGFIRRTGMDLALLVLAGIGYWQLRHYGAPITRTVKGALGLDPFLILAPTVGLLAGAVVVLRVVPLLAGVGERLAANRPGLVGPLGTWQLARRPSRNTRTALMLILALAIGLFAASYDRTWSRSQQDQADHQVGADIAVSPDERFAAVLSPLTLGNSYRAVDGVQAATPVVRRTVRITGRNRAELVALDARSAPGVARLRPDLAGAPAEELFAPLVDGRVAVDGLQLPAGAEQIRAEVSVATTAPGARPEPFVLVLQDADGVIARVASSTVPGEVLQEVTFDLTDEGAGQPAEPIELVGIEARIVPPEGPSVDATATVRDVVAVVDGGPGTALPLEEAPWTSVPGRLVNALAAPEVTSEVSGTAITMHISTGGAPRPTGDAVVFRAAVARDVATVPALATPSYLSGLAAGEGMTRTVDIGGARASLRFVGTVEAFPGVDPEMPVVIIDYATLATMEYQRTGRSMEPDVWWLDVDDARASQVQDRLTAAPFSSRQVLSRFARGESLRSDPVALGIIGALALGFVAATLFAAIGFAVGAVVSARERLTEFSLLRAVGLSPRQLTGWLSLENGVIVGFSILGGTALGLALAWLILPLISLSADAAAAFPAPIVTVPWGTLLRIELLLAAVLFAVVVVVTRLLRRVVLASALRFGEER